MFKKLFSRKKNIVAPAPAKPAKVVKPVEAPKGIAQWAADIQAASGKQRNTLLNRLVESIDKKEFNADDAVKAVSGLPGAMLAVQLDLSLDQVSAEQWPAMVLEGFTAKVRITAAEKIDATDELTTLVKLTKGKDKSVYRILHDKLEAQHQAEKTQQEWQAKKDAVLDSAIKLADASLEPMYEAKLKGLQEQWRELAVDDEKANAAFQTAKQRAQAKIDAVQAEETALREQTQHAEKADSNRQVLIDAVAERMLTRLNSFDLADEVVSEDQHFLSDVQHQWRENEQHTKASKAENGAFQRVCTAFEVGLSRLKNLLEKHGDVNAIVAQLNATDADNEALLHEIDEWLHDVEFLVKESKPEPIARLQAALDQYQQSLAEHRQQEIDRVRAIRGQLRRCLSAVEEGSLRRASGLYHGIEEKLEGFDLTHHAGIRKQLEETTEALEKLRDWQSFAVLPKKEALIKRMTGLVEHSMDPESRAQAIRDMQDEWKLLSRGLQDRQQDLWETFHDLAQKAYEPCREYFSEQRNLREVNLDRRKEVVEQLTKYSEIINWEAADLKEIDQVLQVARNDWRRYSPVDRVANKPLQTQFDRLHKSLFDKLRQEQNVFKDNKLAIIEQAKALLNLDDVKQATERAKQLQSDWKTAGMVSRKDEQELWKAFRDVCDQLFARREEQVTAFKADLEANKAQAETILNSLREIVDAKDVLAQQSAFEALKEQYGNIGTLPKTHYPKLTKQFKDVCSAMEAKQKVAKAQAADQHWVDLIEWVKQARFANSSVEALNEQWQNLRVPAAAQPLERAFGDWLDTANELNQAALHEKTIELEILTGVASPEQDAQMRMNLQVQALSEGIGAKATSASVDKLVVDWLAIGAVEAAEYDALEARMKAARTHWLK